MMTLDIFKEKGTPLDKQLFIWREVVQAPTSQRGVTRADDYIAQVYRFGLLEDFGSVLV